MNNCEFVTFISMLACSIAKNKTQEEIDILAAFFYAITEIHWQHFQH